MTRQTHSFVTCKKCGEPMLCPKCGSYSTQFSPFSDWLRALPPPYTSMRFDNQNLDYIWHDYLHGWFITIEEKRYGGTCSPAQKDTHGIVAQFLALASGALVDTMRGRRRKDYRGHYVIVFDKTTPEDSTWLTINGAKATKADLLALLLNGTTGA